jgi:AcrR family transcriptional regulator
MAGQMDTMPGERTGRREQNKAENRAALLKAARSVFAEIGYNAAGVRDIVRRTDLASGTFYNYFKDKEEIFSAVIAEMSGELLARHREGRARATTAEEFIRRHCSTYLYYVAEDPEILAFGRNNVTPIRNLFDKPDLRHLADAFAVDIQSAIERSILPRVDVAYLMAAITGIVFEISVVMTSREPVNPDEATEFATRLLMTGLANLPKKS